MKTRALLFAALFSCAAPERVPQLLPVRSPGAALAPQLQIQLLKEIQDPQIHTSTGEFARTDLNRDILFSPDETKLAMTQQIGEVIQVYEVPSGKSLFKLIPFTRGVYQIKFSDDSKELLGEGLDDLVNGNNVRTVKTWDATTGKLLSTREGSLTEEPALPSDPRESLGMPILSSAVEYTLIKGDTLMLCGVTTIGGFGGGERDAHCLLWDLAQNKLLAKRDGYCDGIDLHPSGHYYATIESDRAVLWDLAQGKARYTSSEADMMQAFFSADGENLITLQKNGKVQVRDIQTGEALFEMYDPKNPAEYIEIDKNAGPIVFIGRDWQRTAWNTKTGEKIYAFKESHSQTFSPKADFLVTLTYEGFSLWRISAKTKR
jgi:WD40 repeat protein